MGREGLTIFVDVFPHVTSILSSFLISKYERASPMVVKPWAMCLVYGRCMAVYDCHCSTMANRGMADVSSTVRVTAERSPGRSARRSCWVMRGKGR